MAEPKDDDTDGGTPEGEQPAEAPVVAENRRARRAAKARGEGSATARRPERPAATGLDAGERVDDALARAADRATKVVKERFNFLQWLIVAAAAGWIGWQIYTWRSDKAAAKAAFEISEALGAELGRIGPPGEEKRDNRGAVDARKAFATDAERLDAAAKGYRAVMESRAGTGPGTVAKLGLAGVLYDQGKLDDAVKLYKEVAESELAKTDPEARGRSLEGLGLCLEAKGDRDGALKRYSELENTDIPGFRELGLYDQARVLHAKGDDAGAKERLKKVVDKLGKEKTEEGEGNYLLEVAKDLLQRIDPSAVPPPSSDEALQKALQEFQKKMPPGITPIQMPHPGSP